MDFDQETLSRPIGGASNPSPGNSCQRPHDLIGCVSTCLARLRKKKLLLMFFFKCCFLFVFCGWGGRSLYFSAFVICYHVFLFCLQLFIRHYNYLPAGKMLSINFTLRSLFRFLNGILLTLLPRSLLAKKIHMENTLGLTNDCCYYCQSQCLLNVCGQLFSFLYRSTVHHQ